MSDETAGPRNPSVDAEMARIRSAIVPSSGGDKEDLISYAKEVVRLRALRARVAQLEARATPQAGASEAEPVAPFGIDEASLDVLRTNGLKPEEIAGEPVTQAKRVKELLHWFMRLSRGSANPKWTRDHAFELAYYIATTDDRAPIDTYAIEKDAWLKGVKATHVERDQMLRLGFITKAEFDAATPPDSDAVRARVEKLEEVLGDLLSWFDKPSEPEWRLKAGPYGADDAVEAARAALSNQGSSDSA